MFIHFIVLYIIYYSFIRIIFIISFDNRIGLKICGNKPKFLDVGSMSLHNRGV